MFITQKLLLAVASCCCLSAVATAQNVSCLDENGNPVAWWAAIKTQDGTDYGYMDAHSSSFTKSPFTMSSATQGALAHTTQQMYSAASTTARGAYNDEPGFKVCE